MAIGTDKTINMPTVVLTGASSQIGVFAIPRLIDAGFQVIAVSRKGKPDAYPSFEQVLWLNENDALQASASCQYLLSAGPMALAKKFLTTGSQIQTAAVFSSSSVDSKVDSEDPLERDQMRAMSALESELQVIAKNKKADLSIFRPTLIYGCGLDTNISRLAGWVNRLGFLPVNGRAEGLRQPVHADDLASAAVAALRCKVDLPSVLYLTGGETLAYSEMLEKIFKSLEKPVRLVRLPQWLFLLLVKILGTIKTGVGVNGEMVKRQKLDLVFDDRQARVLLDYDPRPFKPLESDFSLPSFD
jgi:nucleoside-diphosphate-sugar epimerase